MIANHQGKEKSPQAKAQGRGIELNLAIIN
jgi:hypothetical protein